MLSKNQIKLIKSLSSKKGRQEAGMFAVEGRKGLFELLKSTFKIKALFITSDFETEYALDLKAINYTVIKQSELDRVTFLKTNTECLALVEVPNFNQSQIQFKNKHILYLDGVSDPGNLGTIIRTADWFGIDQIIVSENTVDWTNSKVIQSTMGSFTRVSIHCLNYEDLQKILPENFPVFSAFLDGDSPKLLKGLKESLIIMGSESHGISDSVNVLNHRKITIPAYGNSGTESLNVAIATSILCYELKRN